MNAEEARKTVLLRRAEKVKEQYREIRKIINDAIDNDQLEVGYYVDILPKVQEKFEAEGYKFEKSSFRNEITITISW